MKTKLSKTEVKKKIDFFFSDIKDKTSDDVRKIKKLAAGQNISLASRRKLFCKKCLYPYRTPKIRIKQKVKSVTCENCGYVSRWRIIPKPS